MSKMKNFSLKPLPEPFTGGNGMPVKDILLFAENYQRRNPRPPWWRVFARAKWDETFLADFNSLQRLYWFAYTLPYLLRGRQGARR